MHDVTIGPKRAVKQRDHGVDFLRCIACCAVVGLHTFNNGLSFVTAAFYYAFGFAVPVFFMASGAFLLNRGVLLVV